MVIAPRFSVNDTVFIYDNGRISKSTVLGVHYGSFVTTEWVKENMLYQLKTLNEVQENSHFTRPDVEVFATPEELVEYFKKNPRNFNINYNEKTPDVVKEFAISEFTNIIESAKVNNELIAVNLREDTPETIVKIILNEIVDSTVEATAEKIADLDSNKQ